MSEPVRICLVGATGLTGRELIEQAVGRSDVHITAVARRQVALPPGARMELVVAEPAEWAEAIAFARAKVMVCALGTTWRQAGKDAAAFRAVDKDLVLACAGHARAAGIERMILVSSVGASRASRQLYLQVKGEVEDLLAKSGFKRLDILRPGLLRGARQGEPRAAERLAMLAAPLTDLVLHGANRKYRSMRIGTLAQVIFALATEKNPGRHVYEHDAMLYALRRPGKARPAS